MSKGFSIHRRLVEIVSEIKRIERIPVTSQDGIKFYEELLLKEAERLQRQYRKYHGFNYHPLMYEGRER